MRKHGASAPFRRSLWKSFNHLEAATVARTHSISGLNPQQQPLFFVGTDERQSMTKIWDRHFHQVDSRKIKMEKKTRQRIEVLVADSKKKGITWTNIQKLLERPIGYYQPSDLDIQPDTDESPHQQVVGDNTEERIVWTDQAMLEMHEGVLLYSLQLLRSTGNANEKLEVLNWIWSPDVEGFVTRKIRGVNQQVPIRADQLPFTFQTCCRLSGYHTDELREGLAWEMRSALAKLGFQPRK